MSEFTDKVKGAVNETVGKAKQAIGRESNDPSLEAEGAGPGSQGQCPDHGRQDQGCREGRRRQILIA